MSSAANAEDAVPGRCELGGEDVIMFDSEKCEPRIDLAIRWLSWRHHGEQIKALRRATAGNDDPWRALSDAAACGAATPSGERDAIHLGAFSDECLVAAVSVYFFRNEPEALARSGLPALPGKVAYYAAPAEAEPGRDLAVRRALLGTLQFMMLSLIRPDAVLVTVPDVAAELREYFAVALALQEMANPGGADGGSLLLGATGPAELRQSLLSARQQYHTASQDCAAPLPSLLKYLESRGLLGLIDIERFKAENLYIQPLSLKDELPRLAAQTRIVLPEQRSRLAAIDFPQGPADFLDLGAGPGVYAAALSKEPMFAGYRFTTLDLAPEMVLFGKLNRPKFRWLNVSAYATGEPAASYDVVQGVFLFVHLMSPDLVLREIARIVKPGGLLYVLDVNDSTFRGPPIIRELIELHTSIYEGDRKVLNVLPGLAAQHGLSLEKKFASQLTNQAPGMEPVYGPDRIDLSREALWGMAALIGQRPEVRQKFEAAQSHYFSSGCDFSVELQTQVYRKG